ncbi:hypothetical protein A3D77_07100 [Candidatus Gottesmanbacteria bacterium RIFCSPHIGHO2_02_FULL_39_11]|uniref:dolichyl-phosphate beta-glucosyltransferase n=1 Tax=Candidatus Gottesmanbacteria bacterium RIFCSPHIGHO2_02_FULL_39_11 TaxID=1798382 RepID=A0A1F5ZJW8_9BACT|nr:MAG: hypothetical protein A3D77_07100 [Candidatus Gottesmanbacteria bacterium RIFCSPHIGHO2_02_FULL_39_11]
MKKSVEIVIPAYNEEKQLRESVLKLATFLNTELRKFIWKITIADNASTDGTLGVAKELTKENKNIHVLHLDLKGRGRAVKKAWKESSADYVGYTDVDLSTDLKSLLNLLDGLEKGYDISIGSRLLPGAKVVGRTLRREIMSRVYNIIIKIFFQTHFSDAQCGFKFVNKRVMKELLPYIRDDAWFFDSEMLIVGEKLGFKIYEKAVHWVDDPGSTVRVMGTVKGDLLGLWRLFKDRPWNQIRKIAPEV